MARPPLYTRQPTDPAEERTLRSLTSARHAPASLVQRARIVTASWDGVGVSELAYHPKTVCRWLHRFNADGLDGLADLAVRACPGGSASMTAAGSSSWPVRSRPAACSRAARGCWPLTSRKAPAHRTLDALAQAAQAEGIRVGGSQVRRILISERVCWRRTRSWATSTDLEFVPKGQVIACYTDPPAETSVICADELDPVIPRSFPPAPGWTADGHCVKAVLDYGRSPEKTWVYGALRVADGQAIT